MSRLALLISLVLFGISDSSAETVLFESQIRPILKAHCFHCHGEDGVTEAGLDLRLRRWIIAGGDSGPAVAVGDPDSSLLLERIESGDMPPGDQPLPQHDIDMLRRWIYQGAETARPEPESLSSEGQITDEERRHWAFQPISRPVVPVVKDPTLTCNPIDCFILSRLEKVGLTYSPIAPHATLARRMHMDLLGIPPEPELVQCLSTESSPTAVRRFVERLLASPAYGERWGRHWLDIAGYADSEGYSEEDRIRDSAFRYRDYVIRSLNEDKPFDEFIREQLAGDEFIEDRSFRNLSAEDQNRLIATGFLRMAPDGTGTGGIDQKVARNQTIADTIDIVSTSLMGMTVACAQCHNHRYDPITQADYYRIRAIFEPALDWKVWKTPPQRKISLYSDAERTRKQEVEKRVATVEAERKEKTQFYIDRTLEEELLKADPAFHDDLRTAYKTKANDRSEEQKKLLQEHPTIQNISSGSLYLYDQRRDQRARKLDTEAKSKLVQLVQNVRERAIDEAPKDIQSELQLASQAEAKVRSETQNSLLAQYPATLATEANVANFEPEGYEAIQDLRDQASHLRSTKAVDDLKQYTDQIAEIRKQIPPEGFVRALAEPDNHRPQTFLFYRGDHEQPREEMSPGGLSVLGADDAISPEVDGKASSGRRSAFANHLTDGNHPLVARVIVNRVWAQHFGQGIVRSLGDFGALGERPTHPELLDWLASELMESGWQLKHLHRLILNSRVYQQTSRRSDERDTKDPDNTLLARMPLRRLDSESIRDSLLAVTGELNREMYGTPVPVREDEVGQIIIGNEVLDGERKPVAGDGLGGAIARRSVYVQVRRSRPLAVLETFDAPRMTPNCAQRSISNVAPQPLMMMNSDFVLERARHLAERVRRDVGEQLEAQLKRAWLLVFSVPATEAEILSSKEYIERQSATLEDQADPLETLCHALISTNRLLYID